MWTRAATLIATAAVGVAAVAVGSAGARPVDTLKRETRTVGNVSATFSYIKKSDYGYARPRLTIRLDGRIVLDGAPSNCRFCDFWPALEGKSLSIVDLDGDRTPEVVLDTFTGGAHCCFVLYVYRQVDARFVPTQLNTASEGYLAKDLDADGIREYVTRDTRFEDLFTAHSDSYAPVRIVNYRHGSFVTVTGRFGAEIRKDEREAWRLYRTQRGKRDVRGVLAAWAAEKYLLREGDDVWPVLKQAVAKRELRGYGGPNDVGYPDRLRSKLRAFGYLTLR
jgi:hypothetical protein